MPRRRPPQRRPVVQSQSDIARRRGCARSTVSRACKPGGALFPALVSPDRIDLSHPACQAFLAAGQDDSEPAAPVVLIEETGLTPLEVATTTGVAVRTVLEDMSGPLAAAIVPPHHLCARAFAWYAGATIEAVIEAAESELAPALTGQGRIDLGHPAALGFLAARPFRRKKNGDPADCPEGYLEPACVGDDIDINSPFARAWLARLDGRVATEEDIERMLAGARSA